VQRYTASALLTVAVFAAFWAYTIATSLVEEFSQNITYIDLGVLFVLGVISGLALGLAFALTRQRSDSAGRREG